jgi:hypothetical protein
MNIFEKQLIMNDGRTLWEHSRKPKFDQDGRRSALDCSRLNIEAPPQQCRISVKEFEETMDQLRKK